MNQVSMSVHRLLRLSASQKVLVALPNRDADALCTEAILDASLVNADLLRAHRLRRSPTRTFSPLEPGSPSSGSRVTSISGYDTALAGAVRFTVV